MSNLINNIKYVETHAGDGEVVECTMYRRRHIFHTEGGLYWVIKKVAGVDGFRSLEQTVDAINEDSDKYPPVPKY